MLVHPVREPNLTVVDKTHHHGSQQRVGGTALVQHRVEAHRTARSSVASRRIEEALTVPGDIDASSGKGIARDFSSNGYGSKAGPRHTRGSGGTRSSSQRYGRRAPARGPAPRRPVAARCRRPLPRQGGGNARPETARMKRGWPRARLPRAGSGGYQRRGPPVTPCHLAGDALCPPGVRASSAQAGFIALRVARAWAPAGP
jgi:hypothetical protein